MGDLFHGFLLDKITGFKRLHGKAFKLGRVQANLASSGTNTLPQPEVEIEVLA